MAIFLLPEQHPRMSSGCSAVARKVGVERRLPGTVLCRNVWGSLEFQTVNVNLQLHDGSWEPLEMVLVTAGKMLTLCWCLAADEGAQSNTSLNMKP